jgi:hypothetical protein
MPIAESLSRRGRIRHLTDEQHQEAARLLNQAMDALAATTSVVQQPSHTDAVLGILALIRAGLVAPLSEGWGAPLTPVANNPYGRSPPAEFPT